MQSQQSRCERSIHAPALGVWLYALRGLCGFMSRFGGVFVWFGRGGCQFRAALRHDGAQSMAFTRCQIVLKGGTPLKKDF